MIKMRMLGTSSVAACLALAGIVGCGSNKSPEPRQPANYRSQMNAELEAERQEFIQDRQEQVQELDNRIAQLQSRIDNESEYVSQDQIDEWQSDLFELKLEKERAAAQLQRAREVTPEQFQAMRGPLEVQFDRLEAATDALVNSVTGVFEDEQEPVRGEDEPVDPDVDVDVDVDQDPADDY
ncbi:MAG TPA: hypothetical protein VKZ49_00630 [Polyangiaceae bacterium]|nr:hypothetical protein [Polyangiaceae bacterium]